MIEYTFKVTGRYQYVALTAVAKNVEGIHICQTYSSEGYEI